MDTPVPVAQPVRQLTIYEKLNLIWRPVTALILAVAQVLIACGILPEASADAINNLMLTLGALILVLSGGSVATNIASTLALARQAGTVQSLASGLSRTADAAVVAAVKEPTSPVVAETSAKVQDQIAAIHREIGA